MNNWENLCEAVNTNTAKTITVPNINKYKLLCIRCINANNGIENYASQTVPIAIFKMGGIFSAIYTTTTGTLFNVYAKYVSDTQIEVYTTLNAYINVTGIY